MIDIPANAPAADKDQPLREDIRLLGDTLRQQEGAERFELVEAIRRSALRLRRDGDLAARAALEALLERLDHDTAVRAFSFFSRLANIAEDLHHNRRRRAGDTDETVKRAILLTINGIAAGLRNSG